MKKKLIIGILLVTMIVIFGCTQATPDPTLPKIQLYKSPTCGCCVGHAAILTGDLFDVETIPMENMNAIKQEFNIPREYSSCHTIIIGDYFVEGHIPTEIIKRLLDDQPDIDGIALPGMPAGTPGMPGIKTETWTIYSIKDGKVVDIFAKI